MSKIIETSLIIRKETVFDKIRQSLLKRFYKNEYNLIKRVDNLMTPKRMKIKDVIIPQEIGKEKL